MSTEDVNNEQNQFLTTSISPLQFESNSLEDHSDSEAALSQTESTGFLPTMTTNSQTVGNSIILSHDDEHELDASYQHSTEVTDQNDVTVETQNTVDCPIESSLPEQTTDDNATDIPTLFQQTVIEEQNLSTFVSNDTPIVDEESITQSPFKYTFGVCCSYGEGENEICNQNQLIESFSSTFEGTDLKKTGDSPAHIMISYNHTTRPLCMIIAQKLRELNYTVWIDQDNISGNIFNAMASAVENSFVVLMAVNENYFQSRYCKLEAEYSVEQNKALVPMLMQSGYKASGWLGIIIGAKLYVDFTQFQFEAAFDLLIREIRAVRADSGGKQCSPTLSNIDAMSSATTMMILDSRPRNVINWTTNDVIDWLRVERLEIFEGSLMNFTGDILWELYKVKLHSPTDYYQMVETLLPIDLPFRLLNNLKFHRALENLFASTKQTNLR